MRANNKITFLDGQFPAVLFPVGPPEEGGTCAFLTEHCREYCPAKVTNPHEQRALAYFQHNDAQTIVNKILDELSELSILHLYWWSWGDCLPEMMEKIIIIMHSLYDRGVLQNGFTRNFDLFRRIWLSHRGPRLRIGYHTETVAEAVRISAEMYPAVTCCPDVQTGKGVLYQSGTMEAKCCGIWCEWVRDDPGQHRMADCQECYVYRQGCFSCTHGD